MFSFGVRTILKKMVPSFKRDIYRCQGLNIDEIEVYLKDTIIRLKRKTSLNIPHEVSIFIPRAEFRERFYKEGKIVYENETILNSITVVHAPQHPLAGETLPVKTPSKKPRMHE